MNRILATVIALIGLSAIQSQAQELDPVSLEQIVNIDIPTYQYSPEAAVADDGSYCIVWYENSWEFGSIMARRYDSNHDPVGDPFAITGASGGRLRIHYWENDKYILAFVESGGDLNFLTLNADNSVGAQITVDTNVEEYGFDMSGENLAFTWQHSGGNPSIALRGYSLNTNDWISNEILVSEDSGNDYFRPSVIYHADGTMTLIYNFLENTSGCCTYDQHVYRKTFSSNFIAEIPEHAIWTSGHEQYVVTGLFATGNNSDEVLILTNYGTTSSNRFYKAWIVARDGEMLLDNEILLSGGQYDWFSNPRGHLYDNGDFVTASAIRDGGWQDPDQSEAMVLYATDYYSESSGFIQMNSTSAGYQEGATVAGFDNGGFVACWDGNGFQGDENGIYTRAYNAVAFPGVKFTHDGPLIISETGTQIPIEVTLGTQPTNAVTVDLGSGDWGEGLLDTEQLFFDAGNWDVPQTVILTGQDDAEDDGDFFFNLLAMTNNSVDSEYAALDGKYFGVTNLDDDATMTLPGTQEFCISTGLVGVNAIITNVGASIQSVIGSSSNQAVVDDSDIIVNAINASTWQVVIENLDNNSIGSATITLTANDGVFDYAGTFDVNTTGVDLDAGADQSVCLGTEVTLTASNPDGADIVWSDNVQDGVSFTPEAGTHTYEVTATLEGCIVTDQVEVQVNDVSNITLEAGADESFCEGTEISLTAENPDGLDIEWDNSVEDGVSFTQEVGTVTYTVSAVLDGCDLEDSVEIEVFATPDIGFTVEELTEVCEGQQVTLEVNNPEEIDIMWSGGIVDGEPFDPELGESTYEASGTYMGCDYSATAVVFVQEMGDTNLDAGEPISVCEGEDIILEADNPDGLAITWDNGVTDGQPFTQDPGTETYTVTAMDGLCAAEDEVEVTVVPLPAVPTITFFGDQLISSSAEGNQWYINGGIIPAETGQYIDPLTEGDYVVTVTIDGCTSESLPYTFMADWISENALDVAMYPNPTNDHLTIEFSGNFQFAIHDMRGKKVADGRGLDLMTLDVSDWVSGLYMISINSSGIVRTQIVEKL